MPISRRLLFLFVDMIQLNVISFIERRDAIREKKRFFPNFFSKDHTCPLPWMLKYKRIIMTIYIFFGWLYTIHPYLFTCNGTSLLTMVHQVCCMCESYYSIWWYSMSSIICEEIGVIELWLSLILVCKLCSINKFYWLIEKDY